MLADIQPKNPDRFSELVVVRFTGLQLSRIKQISEDSDLTLSEYIRTKCEV